METEALCRRCFDLDPCCSYVSTLAYDAKDRCLVSQHGSVGLDRSVLRHGYIQVDSVLRHGVYNPSRIMAVPKSLRGRGVL